MQPCLAQFSLYCLFIFVLYRYSSIYITYVFMYIYFIVFEIQNFSLKNYKQKCQHLILLVYMSLCFQQSTYLKMQRISASYRMKRNKKQYIFWEQLQHSQYNHCHGCELHRAESMCVLLTALSSVPNAVLVIQQMQRSYQKINKVS